MKNKFVNFHFHKAIDDFGIRNFFVNDFDCNQNVSAASVGVHPYHCAYANAAEQIDILKKIVNKKNILAIGEIGLDKSIEVDYSLQKHFFCQQLSIAQMANKLAIIHCVRTFADIVKIYKDNKISVPMIFHGFVGKPETVEQIQKIGCYVSFDNRIVQNRSWDAALNKAFDCNIAFLETDDSEEKIENIYSAAANATGKSIDAIALQTMELFKTIFNL